MIPGEYKIKDRNNDIKINAERTTEKTVTLTITNTGDRPTKTI